MTKAVATTIEASMSDMTDDLTAAADSIRALLTRATQNIFEVGHQLIEVKRRLGHGRFLHWIDEEFSMSDQTARNLMNVAEKYGDGKFKSILNLGVTVLYELAAPSTSPEVREAVEKKVETGEKVSVADVKKLKKLEKENETLRSAVEKAEGAAKIRLMETNDMKVSVERLSSENAALSRQNSELAGEAQAAHAATTAAKAADGVTALSPLHVSVMGAVAAINRISIAGHNEFWRVDDVSAECAKREIDRAISRLQSLLAAGSKPAVEIIPLSHSGGGLEMPPIPEFLDRRETATAE